MYWRDEDGLTFRRGEKAVDHLIKVKDYNIILGSY
jgi:hypothetical protein